MSECQTTPVAGNAVGDEPEGLTPERIEATLADFRAWLYELAAGEASAPPVGAPTPAVDLHTLVAQFAALRHEVNLQTKAVRAQQELNAETLKTLGDSLDALGEAQGDAVQQGNSEENIQRPLLKTLIDLADALDLGRRELQRRQQAIALAISEPTPAGANAGIAAFLHAVIDRLFRRRQRAPAKSERTVCVQQAIEALVVGYVMSLQRVERALEQHGLEPIRYQGQPFDPEYMEVLEAVPESGKPPGQVLDEVRPGYLWNGRVFRYAQVRVAR